MERPILLQENWGYMFTFYRKKDNATVALYAFIKALGASVTERTVEETLVAHPDYPSLLSISDALNKWNIENGAIKLPAERLIEIPTPFLTYLNTEGEMLVLVKTIKNGYVEWLHTQKGWQPESLSDFVGKWRGVALIAELCEKSGEKNYVEKRRKEILTKLRTPVVLIGGVLLLLLGAFLTFGIQAKLTAWNWYGLALIKLLGTGVCTLLLSSTVDKSNSLIKSLCQLNERTRCDSILNSAAAKLGGWLSWAEIGFFYFAGGVFALLLGYSNPSVRALLVTLTLLALPYTLFSIHYQARIARQWCPLCLVVQLVLWIELALGLHEFQTMMWKIEPATTALLAFSFLLPIVGWILLKPVIIKALQADQLQKNIRQLKENSILFKHLLQQEPQMPPVSENLDPLILGNAHAANTLTVVLNPYCHPCASAFSDVEALLADVASIRCQIIFAATNHAGDVRGEFTRHILSLPLEIRSKALEAWYKSNDKNLNKWRRHFTPALPDETATAKVERHREWGITAGIESTPAVYWNGYRLPVTYQIADLKYLGDQRLYN